MTDNETKREFSAEDRREIDRLKAQLRNEDPEYRAAVDAAKAKIRIEDL